MLTPVLFTIFINDLEKALDSVFIKTATDTTVGRRDAITSQEWKITQKDKKRYVAWGENDLAQRTHRRVRIGK